MCSHLHATSQIYGDETHVHYSRLIYTPKTPGYIYLEPLAGSNAVCWSAREIMRNHENQRRSRNETAQLENAWMPVNALPRMRV